MTTKSDRQIALLAVVALPVMAWIFAGKNLEPNLSIVELAKITPQRPLLLLAASIGLLLGVLIAIFVLHNDSEYKGAPFKRHLRGTRIVKARALERKTRDKKKRAQAIVAGIPMPVAVEPLHLLINGSTGTGKTVLLSELSFSLLKRGDRMIFVDPNGDMLTRFGRERDAILNPYDGRTQGWSSFNEVRHDYDYQRLALSMIPRGKTEEAEEWAGYGRLLLQETMRKLALLDKASIHEVFKWTTLKPTDELRAFLEGTTAEALFAGSSEASRALTSARFLLSDKLAPHTIMPAGDFSIRRFLEDKRGGNLFITWREDMAPALRPLNSTWVDVICSSILSMPENESRRIWLCMDELASLDKLPSLESALTKGRKHGLACIAGLQTISQLDDIYGRDSSQTLRSCFRNLVVLGGSKPDAKTSEEMSLSLGEHEVERERITNTSNGESVSIEHCRERVVSPSEITSLPPLSAYVAFAGDYPITKTKLKVRQFKQHAPRFVETETIGA